MGTVNISLPDDLTAKMDMRVKEGGYASRSEFVRNALRNFLAEADWMSKPSDIALAVVTFTYSMERRGVFEEISRLQHKYEDLILTTIHNHAEENCLEIILTRGDQSKVKDFAQRLRVIRGVQVVKVTVA